MQRFQATRARLQVQLVEFDPDEDAQGLQNELEDEVHERLLVERLQGTDHADALSAERRVRDEISARHP